MAGQTLARECLASGILPTVSGLGGFHMLRISSLGLVKLKANCFCMTQSLSYPPNCRGQSSLTEFKGETDLFTYRFLGLRKVLPTGIYGLVHTSV